MNLKKQTLNGIKWTSISSLFITILQVGQLSILAHYLEPSDFGLIAIVYVIIGFSSMFVDMGISASIIHKQDITHVQLSSLYWLNVISGSFLALFVYILAPYVAEFYNKIELISLIRLLALTFIISSLGNQYAIHLQKNLQFELIAKISVISSIIGVATAIILAINDYRVYALVYSALVVNIVSTILYIIVGVKMYKPSFVYNYKEIKPMLSFGMFQMGEGIINFFNSQFDVILIGKLLGVEALGIYTIAKNLAMRPAQIVNPIITKVTFPVMSKVQKNTSSLKNIYLKTINYLSSINFPIYFLMAILAEPIVLLMFGEKWKESIYILQILSIFGAIRSTANPIGSLQLARGRADLGFYWNLSLFFIMPISIYLGSFWELIGISYSLLLLMTFLSIPNWYFMVKPLCDADFKEYFKQIISPLILTIFGGTFAYFICYIVDINNLIVDSFLTGVSMTIAMIVLYKKFHREFWDTFLELVGKKYH